jgi:hypothetical protein
MKNYRLGLFLVGLVVIVLLGGGIYIYARKSSSETEQVKDKNTKKNKKSKKEEKDENKDDEIAVAADNSACVGGKLVEITSWPMPQELFEISSIAWLGDDKIAGVQDQKGIIYSYDLASKKVDKKISFGADGDYEGLTYAGGHYFVMRSDGYMFEVDQSGKVLNEYDLPLTEKDNVEPFYFDAAKNRMLIGQKDGEKGATSKRFFAFDLASRKFDPNPVYTIDLNDSIVACGSAGSGQSKGKKTGKKKGKGAGAAIRPSEIVIDPKSKDIFIADGPNQRILVLSPDGKPKYYLLLDKNSFPQVEGMLFTPSGELYISTEGAKGPAKISKMRIELN